MNRDGQPFRRSKPQKAARQSPPVDLPYDWGRSSIAPGKGKRDGNCNRTACQAPLKGREQWYMRDYGTDNGRLYYCGRCAVDFNASDRRYNEPQRCTFDDETDMSESLRD
jgi:hypothetical protein